MMETLFGTDGIRGEANREPLTPPTLARVGMAIGAALAATSTRRRVLLGRDPRRSGPMLGGALLSGLLATGLDVTEGGVLPTPAVARLTRKRRFAMGIVISASHNPAVDNGVKLFAGNGRKASREFEADVGRGVREPSTRVPASGTGAHRIWDGARDAYLDALLGSFGDLRLTGLRVVADCANGAVSETAPAAFARLGAEIRAIHARPNGLNINRRCGAMHPQAVARAVRRHGADLGVSFDGDGDRAIFADETGRILDGDATLAILARHLLARGRLRQRTVVATVMSNLGLEGSLGEIGCRLARTAVGDRHVAREMAGNGFSLGGEQSGHILVRRGTRLVGDGLETALHLLDAMRRVGKPLSHLARCFDRLPQILLNVKVRSRVPLEGLASVRNVVREVEDRLGDEGRILVRYSGTEPLVRVMVEGPSPGAARRAAERVSSAIEQEIGSTP